MVCSNVLHRLLKLSATRVICSLRSGKELNFLSLSLVVVVFVVVIIMGLVGV